MCEKPEGGKSENKDAPPAGTTELDKNQAVTSSQELSITKWGRRDGNRRKSVLSTKGGPACRPSKELFRKSWGTTERKTQRVHGKQGLWVKLRDLQELEKGSRLRRRCAEK